MVNVMHISNCEFFANSERLCKHCHCQQIEGRISHFVWRIHVFHWHILKFTVKGMHISIANFFQTVTDMANIAIVNKQRVTRTFQLPDLQFDLGLFCRPTRQLERCALRLCTPNKRLDLEVLIVWHTCMLTSYKGTFSFSLSSKSSTYLTIHFMVKCWNWI